MKWFKHQTNARNDERIAHLEQLAGLEGYGFYIKLLEIVAEAMDSTEKCSVTYPLATWSHHLYIHHHTVSKLLSKCQVVGLVDIKYHEGNGKVRIEVIIPNLLKYRDNYTKNLQVTYKQEVELDKEKEVDKEVKLEIEKTLEPNKVKNLPDAIAPAAKQIIVKEETELQIACRATWKAYSDAYFSRHGADPTRNGKISSIIKSFVQRIGMEESPHVAAFYVSHNEQFYVKKLHPVELMLKDAEGLRTQWAVGKTMTTTRARQIDQGQANFSVVAEAMEILERKKHANLA